MNLKKKIEELSILKYVSCIAVILIHISAPLTYEFKQGSFHRTVGIFLNTITKFAVPAFIFASGFALFYGYYKRDINYFKFIKKRLSVVLIPYLVWSILYYGIFIYKGIYPLDFKFGFELIFYGNANYHLYFMVIIIQFYIVFPLFKFIFEKIESIGLGAILIIFMFVASILLVRNYQPVYPKMDRFFITYMGYFSLGCLMAKNYEVIKKYMFKLRFVIYLLYIATFVNYFYQTYYWFGFYEARGVVGQDISFLLYSIMSIILIMEVGSKVNKKVPRDVEASTFYVYLAHPLFLAGFDEFYKRAGHTSITYRFVLEVAVVISFSFVFSLAYIIMKKKLKEQSQKNIA